MSNLEPPDDAAWTWHNFGFQLVDYDYRAWMTLDVETFNLVPIGLAAATPATG